MDEAFIPRKFLAPGGNGFADEMVALFEYENEAVKTLLYRFKREDYEDLKEIFTFYARLAGKKKLLTRGCWIRFLKR